MHASLLQNCLLLKGGVKFRDQGMNADIYMPGDRKSAFTSSSGVFVCAEKKLTQVII